MVLPADAVVDKNSSRHNAGKISGNIRRADNVQLFFKLQYGTYKLYRISTRRFDTEIIFEVAIKLFGTALRLHIFIGRIFRRIFAGIFQVVICAEKIYRLGIRNDVDATRRVFLLADLREPLRYTFSDKYGASTFADRIFIHNRRVNIFVYAVSMLQICTTYTSTVKLLGRKFVLGLFTSPAGYNVFKQVVG